MLANVRLPLHLFLHRTCAIAFIVFHSSWIISVLSVMMKKQQVIEEKKNRTENVSLFSCVRSGFLLSLILRYQIDPCPLALPLQTNFLVGY